ncbi:hypothetical protein BTUL_0090g00330 [Botrytis tulipae]|uniref:Uncharacterized protein n=1 Tax=Botrytis tulipae TaxID=87230 RepID=A0A4Z1ENH5_9HELO|nr:hypothetical protein BTUL_0090g00330 [Botrytis tulipae]
MSRSWISRELRWWRKEERREKEEKEDDDDDDDDDEDDDEEEEQVEEEEEEEEEVEKEQGQDNGTSIRSEYLHVNTHVRRSISLGNMHILIKDKIVLSL